MKKAKLSRLQISPEEALDFLESMRLLAEQRDEPTQAISLRVPGNILRALKVQAKTEGKKYQSLMIQYLRQGLAKLPGED